jgi:hypothetical protein
MQGLDAVPLFMFVGRRFVALALLACACSVDDRRLMPAAEDGTVESFGGAASTGGGDQPDAGDVGAAMGGLVKGCADLDTDGVSDCEETLLDNGTFTSDVQSWAPVGATELSWDPKNALSDSPSGSAKLGVAAPRASARQCAPLSGKQLVIVWANAFVEADADSAKAMLEFTFFDTPDCSGPTGLFVDTPPTHVNNAWAVVQAGQLSPVTTKSVSVDLVGLNGAPDAEFSAYFDNVMLKAKAQ